MTRFGLRLWALGDEVGGSAADYTTMLVAAIMPLGVVAQSSGIIAAGHWLTASSNRCWSRAARWRAASARLGVGEGRGMGFMYILAGLTPVAFAVVSFISRPIWRLEDAIPDQPSRVETEAEAATSL